MSCVANENYLAAQKKRAEEANKQAREKYQEHFGADEGARRVDIISSLMRLNRAAS